MIKEFKTFEAHLRAGIEEFKVSSSQASLSKLQKLDEELVDLPEWQEENLISFVDLTKINTYIGHTQSYNLDDDQLLIHVRPTTFNLVKKSDIDLDQFKVFKIYGVPDNFPSKFVIIKAQHFREEKSYTTLNLNKLQRGDSNQEQVFLKMLADALNCSYDNGLVLREEHDDDWEEEITAYQNVYPNHIEKMEHQIDRFIRFLGFEWNIVYKDNSKLFINKKAKQLFNTDPLFHERGYNFNADKWNPSDIWLINGNMNDLEIEVNQKETLGDLNNWLGTCIRDKEGMVGISLKTSPDARTWLGTINLEGPEPFTYEYDSYEVSDSSMSVKINYKWINTSLPDNHRNRKGYGLIIARNFNGGRNDKIDIEIQAKTHMSGKLTGVLKPIFYGTNFDQLKTKILTQTKESLLIDIDEFNFNDNIRTDFESILNNDKNFDYKERSKLQGLLIVNMIENHENGRDWTITQMVRYGRSQTDVSAPHYMLK